MDIKEILTEQLDFYRMMIKFKNNLVKSTYVSFL
jgi:hypothetical protein